LFAAGEQGAWYDPSDLWSMNTKHDGSGAVPGVGDPVGYIADKSGRGNHAKQTTDTARPTLQQDANGKYYLQFDGVDDLLGTALSTGAVGLLVAGWYLDESAVDAPLGSGAINTTTAGARFSSGVSGELYFAVSDGASRQQVIATGAVVGTPAVTLQAWDGSTLLGRHNGAVKANDAQTVQCGTAPIVIGGASGESLSRLKGRIYSALIRGAASTAAQIAAAERYAAVKTGVTLA